MSVLLFLLLFVPVSLLLAWWVAEGNDRALLIRRTTVAWIVLAPLTAVMNEWMPFTGGGDDENYFDLAQPPPASLAEALDLSRFQGSMEQPGYPALLSMLNALVGHDLLAYKLLNLFLLIALSLVWYRVGLSLENRRFGRAASLAVLAITPLWFYVFALRKDMLIALLQSLFLLGVIEAWRQIRLVPMLVMATVSVGVVTLRSALLVQQVGVLVGSVLVRRWSGGVRKGRLIVPVTLLLMAGLGLAASTNRTFLGLLGIETEYRVASTDMLEHVSEYERTGVAATAAFPVVYLLSETAGLNPKSWIQLDSAWLRGTLALPWILLVVPSLMLGLRYLVTATNGPISARRSAWYSIASFRRSRALSTPWCAVLLFVGSYVAISFLVGDTTRWRTPDMPMTAAIAVAGWVYTVPAIRNRVIVWWVISIGSLFSLLSLFRGV